MAVSMLGMKKSPVKIQRNARQAIDAKIVDLRAAVHDVQKHLDVILQCCEEAEHLHREHIRCEPRSLVQAAERAEIVRQSVEKSWNRSKPKVF